MPKSVSVVSPIKKVVSQTGPPGPAGTTDHSLLTNLQRSAEADAAVVGYYHLGSDKWYIDSDGDFIPKDGSLSVGTSVRPLFNSIMQGTIIRSTASGDFFRPLVIANFPTSQALDILIFQINSVIKSGMNKDAEWYGGFAGCNLNIISISQGTSTTIDLSEIGSSDGANEAEITIGSNQIANGGITLWTVPSGKKIGAKLTFFAVPGVTPFDFAVGAWPAGVVMGSTTTETEPTFEASWTKAELYISKTNSIITYKVVGYK